jgi:hypothetical protein
MENGVVSVHGGAYAGRGVAKDSGKLPAKKRGQGPDGRSEGGEVPER